MLECIAKSALAVGYRAWLPFHSSTQKEYIQHEDKILLFYLASLGYNFIPGDKYDDIHIEKISNRYFESHTLSHSGLSTPQMEYPCSDSSQDTLGLVPGINICNKCCCIIIIFLTIAVLVLK